MSRFTAATSGASRWSAMNAVLMDEAVVDENAIIAAMAFMKAGAQIPPNSLAVSSVAKVVRELTAGEIDWKRRGTASYHRVALEAREKLRPAKALTILEENRCRVMAPVYDPLILERARLSELP